MEVLTDHICLGRFYPRERVPGVLSLPVTDDEAVGAFRKAAAIGDGDEVDFFRLTVIPDESKAWLLPGDVVCRYQALDESMMDLVRPNATSTLVLWDKRERLDVEALEEARGQAIEEHRWVFHRSDMQVTVVDPFGRAAALVGNPGAFTRLFTGLASIVPRTDFEKLRHSKLPPEALCAGHFALRVLHRSMIRGGLDVDSDVYFKFKRGAQALYDLRRKCAMYDPNEECLRIHFTPTSRATSLRARPAQLEFIRLCKTLHRIDPAKLPRPIRVMAGKHYHLRWVRLSPREWEQCLVFWYDNYDGHWKKIFGLTVIKPEDVGYKRWAYKN